MSTNTRPVTGTDLQVERVRKHVSVSDLARAMGYRNHSRVSQIEGQIVPTRRMVDAYRKALDTFPDVETSQGAA